MQKGELTSERENESQIFPLSSFHELSERNKLNNLSQYRKNIKMVVKTNLLEILRTHSASVVLSCLGKQPSQHIHHLSWPRPLVTRTLSFVGFTYNICPSMADRGDYLLSLFESCLKSWRQGNLFSTNLQSRVPTLHNTWKM